MFFLILVGLNYFYFFFCYCCFGKTYLQKLFQMHFTNSNFFLSLSLFPFARISGKKDRKVEMTTSKNGDCILLIDQYRYFKDNENKMVIFWKCHEYFKSKCPASVATTKGENSPRVVVLNDVHLHTRQKTKRNDKHNKTT